MIITGDDQCRRIFATARLDQRRQSGHGGLGSRAPVAVVATKVARHRTAQLVAQRRRLPAATSTQRVVVIILGR